MNETTKQLRSKLLFRYYKTAQLGWFHPKTLHWAKIVTDDGYWRWIRTDGGIRRKLIQLAPVHVYQTVLRFRTKGPPRGRRSSGFLLGGPILFETDLLDKHEPLSIWKVIDSVPMIQDLIEFIKNLGDYEVDRITYSGFRGVHIVFSEQSQSGAPIKLENKGMFSRNLKDLIKERKQFARAVGFRCREWDWSVSADIWRVARVPWSMHGESSLRAIPLKLTTNGSLLKKQLREASPFSFSTSLRVRMKRDIPPFTFVDGELYGPYRNGWATKLPIAVAIHLVWQDLARPRELGPTRVEKWFGRGWQILFQENFNTKSKDENLSEGVAT